MGRGVRGPAHAALIQNVSALLGNALRGRRCRPTSSAQRIRISDAHAVYPDAIVVCPPFQRAPDDPDAFTNPVVVMEVLSPSTQAWDRGGKFELYRSVPSLRHVVLVRQDAWRVEHYRRMDDGSWLLRDLGPGDAVDRDAVEARVAIDELYEGVEAFDGPARDANPSPRPPALPD